MTARDIINLTGRPPGIYVEHDNTPRPAKFRYFVCYTIPVFPPEFGRAEGGTIGEAMRNAAAEIKAKLKQHGKQNIPRQARNNT